jgi:hypothetical protein
MAAAAARGGGGVNGRRKRPRWKRERVFEGV